MALTFTWLGSTGGWNRNTAWSAGQPPGASGTDVILFNGSGAYTATLDYNLANNPDRLIITNPNATINFVDGQPLEVTNAPNSDLQMSAGTLTLLGDLNGNLLGMNTGAISGGQLNIGFNSEVDIENAGTLTLTSTGSIALTGGELDIGTQTFNLGGPTSGLVYVNGGKALITGGNLTGLAFLIDNTVGTNTLGIAVGVGSFIQSAGTVAISGLATFGGGTDTFSGSALFQAGTVALNTAIALNGGTLQSTSSGISIASTTIVTMGGGTLDGIAGGITNSGTITGRGVLKGGITGTGTIVANNGTLEIFNNVAASTNILNVSGSSVLKLDGTVGANVNLGAATTTGVIEFGNAAALTNFTGTIANLDIGASASSVSGFEFINLQAVTVAEVKIGGVATHTFNGTAKTIELYSDAAATTLIKTLTLAAAPTNGTFLDWGLDSAVNGNALGGTDVFLSTVICYAEGTLIQTEAGEVPVESLAEGDRVVTLQDGQPVPMPVKWLGIRTIDIARHPHPHTVAPIRIRAGAFGDDLPRRDLLVSPAHAIYVDGKLVPANLLINHMTVVQDLHTTSVTYYHVELDRHSLILAEGLPSESYLDTGNRAYFANAGLAMVLHPEFHVNAGLKQWEEDACAPLAIDAETITPIWQTLSDRAETLGYVPPRFTTTTDADLYLEANGRRLRPIAVANGRHTFMLPAGANDIVLKSRTSAPADLDPLSGDWRPLGVAVHAMTLRNGDDHIVIPADHPSLTQGWHSAEAGDGSVWRWTTGHAAIPMPGTTGPAMLDIDIGAMGTYILARSDRDPQRLAA